jgi:putative DNA primase/helicase
VALWILHAHAHDAAAISAILAVISPEKRCGKTTLLSLLNELTPRPLAASNISASALFRAIEAGRPTLIVDEADTFLAKSSELRGVLNSGHNRRAAFVLRVEKIGKKQTPVQYSTWAPKVIASIGNLSDTLQDRSIAIRLRRKLPSENVRNFRADRVQALTNLCRMAARWAADNLDELRKVDALVPGQLNDRQADNWRALFNIADRIGREWPAKARAAALAIEGAAGDCESTCETSPVRLLADCRTIFEDQDATELSAKEIIAGLCGLEEAPWADYRSGKPITQPAFARLLEPFGIKSKRITSGKKDKGCKKWHRADFEDVWRRYLS